MVKEMTALLDIREKVLTALRREAKAIARRKGEASANDIRYLLDKFGYTGDPRILGVVFRGKGWYPIGWTTTNSERAHARPIRIFGYAG